MIRLRSRILAIAATAAMLGGCGGGGQSAAVPVASTNPTAGGSSAGRTPVATTTLTIKAPPGFHTAKSLVRRTAGGSRKPSYVNAGAYYLDVWVVANGAATHVVDSTGNQNVNLNNGDGTQSFTIPLFSTVANSIVAYETDQQFQSSGLLLALGEAEVGPFTPGSAPSVSLTMQMNANAIGITTDQIAGSDATTLASVGSPFTIGGGSTTVYFFAADDEQGFVSAPGVGGVTQPTISNVTPSGYFSQNPGLGSGYTVNFGGCAGGQVNVTLSIPNPAFNIGVAAYDNLPTYPGAQFLYQNPSYDASFQWYMTQAAGNVGRTSTIGIFAPDLC